MDEAADRFEEALLGFLSLAEKKNILRILVRAIERTGRRVKALENIPSPPCALQVSRIP